MIPTTKILAGLAAFALTAAPAAFAVHSENAGTASAKPDKPDKPDHAVGYVFMGTYSGDGSTVAITKGNKHVARAELVGTSVAFDFTSAKIVTTDTNGDGEQSVDDVAAGDKVSVKAKLAKSNPGASPYEAKHLIDQTHTAPAPAPVPAA